MWGIFSLRIGSKFMVVLNGYDLIKEVLADDFSDRPLTVFDLGLRGKALQTVGSQRFKNMFKLHSVFQRIGSKVIALLYGYELIKEILVHRARDFTDRPVTVIDLVNDTPKCGIFGSSGKVWKEQRTVSLHILRNFGLGKTLSADKIQKELHHYIQHLSVNTEKPIDILPMTNGSISNNICSILLGRRYLPGDLFHIKETERGVKEIFQLFDVCIEKCPRSERLECFLTEYLKEQKKREQSGVTMTMDERNLKMIFSDLFAAGSETTSMTIYWFVLYMLHHPDVQKKVFDEINEHVGTESEPNIRDKQNLTYLNAAIMETQRLASIVPNSVPRTCHSDMQVRGYTIRKDALILPCLDSVLHDSQI
ncbi:cytochrome P450 2U1 [Biomphalaria pfeifferi]|uniref:Cytochrome P450 2U1 n=1 Tax=Biomphalaria pfeifferi TaxID=112525 RepID=A0AAD8AVA2_BIOPF|nr:cytochrome P450 2U1 [Biomphalaria pfeifferi]